MKYLALITILTLSACSKSNKDHTRTVYGQITGTPGYSPAYLDIRVTHGGFSMGPTALQITAFETDSNGYFRFELEPSPSDDSISLIHYTAQWADCSGSIRIPAGKSSIDAGHITLNVAPL